MVFHVRCHYGVANWPVQLAADVNGAARGASCAGDRRVWVGMMGRRGFTRRDPWVTLVGHVDGGGGGYVVCGGRGRGCVGSFCTSCSVLL